MKRTPLIQRGAIYRRERMVNAGDLHYEFNQIKSTAAIYYAELDVVMIWHHPSARFVELKPGESVIYTNEHGKEVRYVQK